MQEGRHVHTEEMIMPVAWFVPAATAEGYAGGDGRGSAQACRLVSAAGWLLGFGYQHGPGTAALATLRYRDINLPT